MVFNATFNSISVISWRSLLLVEESGVLGENHRPTVGHWQTLTHNVVSSRIQTHNFSGDKESSTVAGSPKPDACKIVQKWVVPQAQRACEKKVI
jgi:hypothetical protein